MMPLRLGSSNGRLRVLALAAHSDDIEIGAGGTLLALNDDVAGLDVHYVVLTADRERAAEAQASAAAFLPDAQLTVAVHGLTDGHLPAEWGETKDILQELAAQQLPDLILSPTPVDAHQDHRTLAEIVPTAFRDSLVLQYEIPKWDGDLGLGRPTHYVPLTAAQMQRKCELLHEHFGSQKSRDWFSDETFRGLARLRGIECRAPYAEAFAVPKAVLGFAAPQTSTQ
jgi:LmbE family N-acetylglucosaminyl deacetylase